MSIHIFQVSPLSVGPIQTQNWNLVANVHAIVLAPDGARS